MSRAGPVPWVSPGGSVEASSPGPPDGPQEGAEEVRAKPRTLADPGRSALRFPSSGMALK